jgi:hypothetical protein
METAMNQISSTPAGPPAERISLIQTSLRSFGFSLAGLIPVIGFPFALAAVVLTHRARKMAAGWNPAEGYLKAAGWLGPLSFLITAVFLMALAVLNSALRDGLLGSSFGCSTGAG